LWCSCKIDRNRGPQKSKYSTRIIDEGGGKTRFTGHTLRIVHLNGKKNCCELVLLVKGFLPCGYKKKGK